MTGGDNQLLLILLQTIITPSVVVALIISGHLVPKKTHDETVKWAGICLDLYKEVRQEQDLDREVMREMHGTVKRIFEEVYHGNGRRVP